MKGTFVAIGLGLAIGTPAVHSLPAPDFSGNWVLAKATASGARSASGGQVPRAAEERPTSSHTAFGAAFNCGRECTILHEAQTLKIEKAFLAERTGAAPTVTLQLNGRHLSPVLGASVPVTAAWNAEKLEIVTELTPVGYSQTLWIDGTQLVVVTSDAHGMSRVTLRYNKK